MHPTSNRVKQALSDKKLSPYFQDLIPEQSAQPPEGSTSGPEFDIKDYLNRAALPQKPQNPLVFTFKTDFSVGQAKITADKFLGSQTDYEISDESDSLIFTSPYGNLIFDRQTGAYVVNSLYTKVPFEIPSLSADIRPQLTEYLKNDLGIIDEYTSATAFYRKSDSPELTYVEFHRDWEKVGYPILNIAAIPTLSENQKMSEIALDKFSDSDPRDDTIFFASDNPGFARRTDFNSLTVGYSKDGYLVSIKSNLRPLDKVSSVEALNLTLFDPKDIEVELDENGGYFQIALPAGEGLIDYDKVFLNNKLKAENAFITEILPAYIEKPEGISQKYLTLSYIIRGYTQTETGIRTLFTQAIPALDTDKLSATDKIGRYLAKIFTNIANAQDNPDLTPAPSSTPTPTPQPFYCYEDSPECLWITPTSSTPSPTTVPPTPTSTIFKPTSTPVPIITIPNHITPTSTPNPTPTKSVPSNTPWPTPTKKPTQTPNPTPTGMPCVIEGPDGKLIYPEKCVFITGIGEVCFFPNLPIPAMVVGRISYMSMTSTQRNSLSDFISTQKKALLKKLATAILAKPSLITYEEVPNTYYAGYYYYNKYPYLSNNHYLVNIAHIAKEVFNTDITNAKNNRGLPATRTPEYTELQIELHKAIKKESNSPTLNDLAANSTILDSISFGTVFQALLGTQQGGGTLIKKIRDQGYKIPAICTPITGSSPSLYFYPKKKTSISLTLDEKKLLYADPYIKKHYSFTADADSVLNFSGITRDRFYYEYIKADVAFSKPSQGWILQTKDLYEFVDNSLSKKLQLRASEIADLKADIRGSLVKTEKKPFIFIGLISPKEINNKLPLNISPKPDTLTRIHFYLEYQDNSRQNIKPPLLKPVQRFGFSVLELGVYHLSK